MKKSELKNFIREEIISTLSESIEDETAALEDYEAKLDDVIKKKEEAGIEEDASDADRVTYIDIGSGYLQGFNRPHSLSKDELETLGRKIVSSLYKGDIDRTLGS